MWPEIAPEVNYKCSEWNRNELISLVFMDVWVAAMIFIRFASFSASLASLMARWKPVTQICRSSILRDRKMYYRDMAYTSILK